MSRQYWLDLFTGKTWEEFLKSGAKVSGFRTRRRNIASKIQIGDYFLCYLTGLSRFVGVLEVKSKSFTDNTKIWEDEDFPIRFKVELIYKLEPLTSVPVFDLKDKLSIFKNLSSPRAWSGFFRGSPAIFNEVDGEIIVNAIKEAAENPVKKEFDEKLYWRRPRTFESKVGIVTVPEESIEEPATEAEEIETKASHEEIQWLLLDIGSKLGLDVWVARNDRNKQFDGHSFADIKNLRKTLPRQFDEATNKTIELIDVLWLKGDAIVAAFEVEHTSSIYSGLLRMSDLVSMQPNININLYIVAPDERHDKVINEINRPTFARLNPSLPHICKYIPYSELKNKISEAKGFIKHLKPEFIDDIAESCEAEEY